MLEQVEMTDQDRALETRFRVAEAATAALAAGGAIAGSLMGNHRTRISTRAAEASLMSYHFLRYHDSAKAPPERTAQQTRPVGGFMQTGDGRWMYMHPGFPHNTEALMQILGNPKDRPAAQRALEKRTAPDLEKEIWTKGLCSAMVRSPSEWDESTHCQFLSCRPVVDIIQIGDADPIGPKTSLGRPLNGFRVLDLTRVLAGPTCARTLASYGAETLRIGAEHLPSVPMFVTDTGHGKRTAFLNLQEKKPREQLNKLLSEAHVFSQGYRTGAMERLGFGLNEVAQKRPGIVYVSINCYGHEGPMRKIPGWEQLAQTVSGMAFEHGRHVNKGTPLLQPAAVTDYTTGYLAALGTLTALKRQREFGGTYWVRVSLTRTAMWLRSLGFRDNTHNEPIGSKEQKKLTMSSETSWGKITHLAPAVAIDGTEVTWKQPSMPLGQSNAEWQTN